MNQVVFEQGLVDVKINFVQQHFRHTEAKNMRHKLIKINLVFFTNALQSFFAVQLLLVQDGFD